ncbi:MAG: FAD/NAD(P)-binding oxidoreductase, partial [Alphaproteobacteria bacterium]
VMFSVPYFAGPLLDVAKRYGIKVNFKTNLRAVNGDEKMAVFDVQQDDGSVKQVEKKFDMIHVSPPQSAPDVIKRSPLANDAGWVDVDQNSMQHKRYANVFALGDAGSTPNSKTAAAVRKQAPVVVTNALATLRRDHGSGAYDGYASCPLTTAYGKVMLAEFCYGGKVTPTFPLDPKVERRSMWWLKTKFLPYLYWNHMLKGKMFDILHKEWRST